MPIYAYKCSDCGHAQDVLQKMSDPLLTDCPECGKSTYVKQVTAAGFQLKGSGWYVTDFRDGGKKSDAAGPGAAGQGGSADSGSASGESSASSQPASKPADTASSTATSSTASAPAAAS